MIIKDFLKENNFTLSPKGIEYLHLAIREMYPNLPKDKEYYIYLAYDLNEEECIKILLLTIRYLKVSAFY